MTSPAMSTLQTNQNATTGQPGPKASVFSHESEVLNDIARTDHERSLFILWWCGWHDGDIERSDTLLAWEAWKASARAKR